LLGSNPFLEMAGLIVAETTCDGKKKMYELMGESRPMFVLELPQKENDGEALERWTGQLQRLREELETRFGVEITDCKIRRAIHAMNRERQLRRELAALMEAEVPPLDGCQLLKLKTSLSGVAEDLARFEQALAWLKEKQADPALAGKVRVLLTGVPTVSGAERVVRIIEQHGGMVVCMESCTGLKPILEDVDETAADPLRALAEKYYHTPCSVMTPNSNRMQSILSLARRFRAECVIELIWQACLTYDVESHKVRRLVEDELGRPYLRIETDYSPSDTARIAVRIEALFETVRAMTKDHY
jgi:benzoyl-CoA reductase/2-hydroxyglutaryl-CoA dehydratase subunit BcrC/BadD/HgdB